MTEFELLEQVAKMGRVLPRSARKWFDCGSLRGYRIPGSTERRVPHTNLIRFMEDHGFQIPPQPTIGDR